MGAGQPNFLVHVRVTAAILLTIRAVAFASIPSHPPPPLQRVPRRPLGLTLSSCRQLAFLSAAGPNGFPKVAASYASLRKQSCRSPDLAQFLPLPIRKVDFNAARDSFSGQKTRGDKWQVWEMDADGAHKRQVTRCAEDCLRPGFLPGGEIVFTALEQNNGSYLAVANIDGSNLHRITFSPGDWWFETVLRDGRILASASSPLSSAAQNSAPRLFYTLRPDGAAMDSLRCDHQPPSMREDAQELEDGSIIFIRTPVHPSQPGGHLTEIQRGALAENKIGPAGAGYLSPRPYFQNQLIVARRQSQSVSAPQRFALYSFDLQKQLIGPVIYSDPHLSSIRPSAHLASGTQEVLEHSDLDSKTRLLHFPG